MSHPITRSFQFRLPLIAFGLFVAVSMAIRIALCIAARHDLDWGVPLLQSLAAGFGFDLVTALFAALPWLIVSAVVPARIAHSRAGSVIIFASMAVYMSVLIFMVLPQNLC